MPRHALPALLLTALGAGVTPAVAIDLTGEPYFDTQATLVVQAPGKAPVGVDRYFRTEQNGQWNVAARAIDSGPPLGTGRSEAEIAAMSTYGRVSLSAAGTASLNTD